MSLFSSETIVTPTIVSPTINTPNIVGVVGSGSNAAAGSVGELISTLVASGSAVALTNATAANVASVSLTAGDWEVAGSVNFAATSATTVEGGLFVAGINATSATIPTDGSEVQGLATAVTTTSFKTGITLPNKRISISATTSVYLVAEATFSAGSAAAYGHIHARRVR